MGLWHVNEGSYQLPAAAQRRAPILPAAAEARDDGEGGEGEPTRPAWAAGVAGGLVEWEDRTLGLPSWLLAAR